MSNPVLNENRFRPESDDTQAGWAAPAAAATRPAVTGMPPTAGGLGGAVMTVGGTIRATLLLWVLILASGSFGWSQVVQPDPVFDPATGQMVQPVQWPTWIFIPMLVGLGIAFAIAFRPKLARFLAPVYAVCFGAALGAISAIYELAWSGIVAQAILATLGVFGVMLFLYASRIIKVTRRFAMVVVGATLGIFVMYLLSFVASLLGADLLFWREPSLLGIGISVFIAVVAALNLALDFAFIEEATQRGMPAYMNWVGAFGITVTIVWLYIEMLRLISLIRQ
ncbi:MAG: Bax inhibitor-1/YccA family protein [Acidimicrobiia bacterium]|nr:Bax inhibitor-1/YccA family protein [Acidimicrobiia bacterium]